MWADAYFAIHRAELIVEATDTRSLARYLGHRNLESMARYTGLAPDRFAKFWQDFERCSENVRRHPQQSITNHLAPIARRNRIEIMTAPTSGGSGDGAEIGAGLSRTRTGPDVIMNVNFNDRGKLV
jgi:hypothetical protein